MLHPSEQNFYKPLGKYVLSPGVYRNQDQMWVVKLQNEVNDPGYDMGGPLVGPLFSVAWSYWRERRGGAVPFAVFLSFSCRF